MKVNITKRVLLLLATILLISQTPAVAQSPPAKRADPTVEQRLEDLEAYINNAAAPGRHLHQQRQLQTGRL